MCCSVEQASRKSVRHHYFVTVAIFCHLMQIVGNLLNSYSTIYQRFVEILPYFVNRVYRSRLVEHKPKLQFLAFVVMKIMYICRLDQNDV